MMREQIRLKPDKSSQLDRSPVRQRQLIDDRKTDWIAQRRMTLSSRFQRWCHDRSLITQILLSQIVTSYWCFERGI